MANQKQFTSKFVKNRTRGGSLAKAPPKPPKTLSNGGVNDHFRRQLSQYQNMYKQTKNQLEVLKSQYKGMEKQLKIYQSQKEAIDANHSNIVLWQKKLANLEMQKRTLVDKNGLFLQQKNTYLLQLASEQERNDEFKIQIENKNTEITKLENELLNSTSNYTQQLSKKDNKYKSLKNEYNSLNKQYMVIKQDKNCMSDQLKDTKAQFKEISQENLLIQDKYNKLQKEYEILNNDKNQLQERISQVKGDSTIAVQLAQKKDKNIIKDLRQTLKTETMKSQQFRAEYLQLKDELNDLRDWRENYLRQEKLQQTQTQTQNNNMNSINNETKISEENDASDNTSVTSSSSNHTNSSKNSRNSITIKNKLKIMKNKSVTAIKNVELPSFQNLLSNEFGMNDIMDHENDEKTREEIQQISKISTREHDEFIAALSNRLAIVKENYINLKQVLTGKNEEIETLNMELSKKKEWIADLIEKLNDKPLPPTPTELNQLERQKQQINKQSDEDKVLLNLEQQGLCPQLLNNNNRTPPKRLPPSIPKIPPPKVVVSPSYNKGIVHNTYLTLNNDSNDSNDEVNKQQNCNHPKSYRMNENNMQSTPLIGNHGNDSELMDGDGI